MKFLLIGYKGQLGQEFSKIFESKGYSYIGVDLPEFDIASLNKTFEIVGEYKPNVIINCSAYNQVDLAEKNVLDCYRVNSIGVRNIGYVGKKFDVRVVHFSTDYVYDGEKQNGLYNEEDVPNPLSQYGWSKLIGEKLLEEETENYLIFRTSWLYGHGNQNFVYKLCNWAKSQEELKIATDEVSIPTYTGVVAEVALKAIEKGLKGLFCLTNSGYCSRYEFAEFVLKNLGIERKIVPVSKDFFNLPAKRPKFSAMSNKKISYELDISIADWDVSLAEYLKGIKF